MRTAASSEERFSTQCGMLERSSVAAARSSAPIRASGVGSSNEGSTDAPHPASAHVASRAGRSVRAADMREVYGYRGIGSIAPLQ